MMLESITPEAKIKMSPVSASEQPILAQFDVNVQLCVSYLSDMDG